MIGVQPIMRGGGVRRSRIGGRRNRARSPRVPTLLPMPRHTRLNAALDNTLGTFASQYTRWQGYVLFGFLDPDAPPLNFDLLRPPAVCVDVVTYAHQRAATAFYEQARNQQVHHLVTAASLTLEFGSDPVDFTVYHNVETRRTGRVLTFTAQATSRYASYTRTRRVNIARHDAGLEGHSDHE